MANKAEMLQEVQDAKDAVKASAAYDAALTNTELAPKPETKPAPKQAPKTKKMAGGGVTRADGCITKGHTRGKMV